MEEKFAFGKDADLQELLETGPCTMAFQPILEIPSGKVHGFEALLRGSNGTSFPAPDRFFNWPGYLENEVLLRLDTACVGSALRSGRDLAKKHRLFINIHFHTLRHLSDHIPSFVRLLDRLDISPSHIVFELSEETDPSVFADVEHYLVGFIELGVEVAIDDIDGSFDWVHHMLAAKPSYLKVDRSLIHDIDVSRKKHALVKSLNTMSTAVGLHLIAEGIEHEGQVKAMREIGVVFAQGFWYGRPSEAKAWL